MYLKFLKTSSFQNFPSLLELRNRRIRWKFATKGAQTTRSPRLTVVQELIKLLKTWEKLRCQKTTSQAKLQRTT